MNCMHDRNKETFWVVLRKQKSRAKTHAIMQSKRNTNKNVQINVTASSTKNIYHKAPNFDYAFAQALWGMVAAIKAIEFRSRTQN